MWKEESVHTRVVEGGINDNTYTVLRIVPVSANFCGKSEKALRINLKFRDNNSVQHDANDDLNFFRHWTTTEKKFRKQHGVEITTVKGIIS